MLQKNKIKFEYIRCLFQSANRNQKLSAAMFMAAKFMMPFAAFAMWTNRDAGAAMIGVYASLVMGSFCVALYDAVQRYYFKEIGNE